MRKLRLEAILVEGFATIETPTNLRGTIQGHESGDKFTCQAGCYPTFYGPAETCYRSCDGFTCVGGGPGCHM